MANEEKGETRKSMSGKTLTEVTVAHRAFPYRVEEEHPYEPDKITMQDRTAMRGDKIHVLPFDLDRGNRTGAFLKPGQNVEDLGTGTVSSDLAFSAADATDTELINWIKDEGPTVQQVVDASEGDAELAARLLAAENAATGNDPRKGVVAGLETVVARAQE